MPNSQHRSPSKSTDQKGMSVGIHPFVLVGAPTLVRSDRRNQTRNQRRQLGKEPDVVTLSDSETALELARVASAVDVPKLLQFDTQLPLVTFTAVLQVYRAAVDAPLHAVGGQIWRGTQKEADIPSIHCLKLTPRLVEIYLERLLKKLNEAYGIRKFASIEELHPQCCPLPGCRGDG